MTNFLMAMLLEIVQQGYEPGTVNVGMEISISPLNCQAYMTYLIQNIPWVTESYFNITPCFLYPTVGKVSFITQFFSSNYKDYGLLSVSCVTYIKMYSFLLEI